jgi:hypothetical protein
MVMYATLKSPYISVKKIYGLIIRCSFNSNHGYLVGILRS